MKYCFANTFLIVALFFSPTNTQQVSEWELKKDEDDIKVYTREVANYNIKEFKASTIINVPKESLLKILLDIPNYPIWIEDVEDAAIINQARDTRDFYYQLSLPWPIKDRDIAMSMKIFPQQDGSLILKSVGHPELIPEKDGFIRMGKVSGHWQVVPIDENYCHVTYQFLADPEGTLPAWLINIFLVDSPYKTLLNLKDYALLDAK